MTQNEWFLFLGDCATFLHHINLIFGQIAFIWSIVDIFAVSSSNFSNFETLNFFTFWSTISKVLRVETQLNHGLTLDIWGLKCVWHWMSSYRHVFRIIKKLESQLAMRITVLFYWEISALYPHNFELLNFPSKNGNNWIAVKKASQAKRHTAI